MKATYILMLFILALTFYCHPKKENVSLNEPIQDKDTIIIKIGDQFENKEERLKIQLFDINGKLISHFDNNIPIEVFPQLNYHIKYKISPISEELAITKLDTGRYLFLTKIKDSLNLNTKTNIKFAFISDSSQQLLFYKYRGTNKDPNKEYIQKIDTFMIADYPVK